MFKIVNNRAKNAMAHAVTQWKNGQEKLITHSTGSFFQACQCKLLLHFQSLLGLFPRTYPSISARLSSSQLSYNRLHISNFMNIPKYT